MFISALAVSQNEFESCGIAANPILCIPGCILFHRERKREERVLYGQEEPRSLHFCDILIINLALQPTLTFDLHKLRAAELRANPPTMTTPHENTGSHITIVTISQGSGATRCNIALLCQSAELHYSITHPHAPCHVTVKLTN